MSINCTNLSSDLPWYKDSTTVVHTSPKFCARDRVMAPTASVSTECDSETSSVSVTVKQNLPEVVRFVFREFTIDGTANKWKARCSTCIETIMETGVQPQDLLGMFSVHATQLIFIEQCHSFRGAGWNRLQATYNRRSQTPVWRPSLTMIFFFRKVDRTNWWKSHQFVSSTFLEKKRFLLFWICDSVALTQFCKLISFCI